MRLRYLRTFDWALFVVPVLLLVTGIATIYTVTYVNKGSELAVTQATYGIIGLILMMALTFLDYRLWRGLSLLIYSIGLIFLAMLVVKPISSSALVISAYGATRWIRLGFFQLQPSELFKLILIIVLAGYFAQHREHFSWKNVMVAIGITALPAGLTLMQPDLGTATVLVAILLSMLLTVGLPRIYYLIMGGAAGILIPIGWFVLKDYQRERLLTFMDPGRDPLGAGYNVIQSMIAVGSGGLNGRGFGQGSQSQLNFLPVAHTDFIFAGFAEATGFIGAIILIILFVYLFLRMVGVAKVAKDDFGTFLATGAAAMLLFQVFVNIGMNIAIMPVTGIPLPFMSSGGTALIICLMTMGILQSVYLRHKKITF